MHCPPHGVVFLFHNAVTLLHVEHSFLNMQGLEEELGSDEAVRDAVTPGRDLRHEFFYIGVPCEYVRGESEEMSQYFECLLKFLKYVMSHLW